MVRGGSGDAVPVPCAEMLDCADARTDRASRELEAAAEDACGVVEALADVLREEAACEVGTSECLTLVVSTTVTETVVGSDFSASEDFVTVWKTVVGWSSAASAAEDPPSTSTTE